jgi:hypothetical protein
METKNSVDCGDEIYYDGFDRISMTIEEEAEDTFIGLYDAEGRELHRVKPRMGFIQ